MSNDDVAIKRIAAILSESGEIENLGANHIVITIRGRQGAPDRKLVADYVRYVRSPLSGHRYLVAGSGTPVNARLARTGRRRWLYKLRDFYKGFYSGRKIAYRPKFAKIMTIKADNIIAITPNADTF